MQINKSDRNDAAASPASCRPAGLRSVRVRASITTRLGHCGEPGVAVKIKRDLENQIAAVKNVGLVIGRAKFNVFSVRARN